MAKRRAGARSKPTRSEVDAALTALCGTSQAAKEKYKATVLAHAKRDAETLVTFLTEIGFPVKPRATQLEDFFTCLERTLASIFRASLRGDASYSTELARFTYRFALDPRKEVEGDLRWFAARRLADRWVIRACSCLKHAVLPRAPNEPVREYTVPFTVMLLDCVLPARRDLDKLRNLIVGFLGRAPTGEECWPEERVQPSIEVNKSHRTVRFCDIELPLAYVETSVFMVLCEGKGLPVSDDTVAKKVWSRDIAPLSLRSHVSRIRTAFQEAVGRIDDKSLRKQAAPIAAEIIPPKKRGVGYQVSRPDLIQLSDA